MKHTDILNEQSEQKKEEKKKGVNEPIMEGMNHLYGDWLNNKKNKRVLQSGGRCCRKEEGSCAALGILNVAGCFLFNISSFIATILSFFFFRFQVECGPMRAMSKNKVQYVDPFSHV